MNERIRELAEQAEQYAHELIDPSLNWNEQPRYFTEKFAELIVSECIKQIAMSSVCFTADQVRIKNMATNCIKEHFGINR